jgi:hypothetical protein
MTSGWRLVFYTGQGQRFSSLSLCQEWLWYGMMQNKNGGLWDAGEERDETSAVTRFKIYSLV